MLGLGKKKEPQRWNGEYAIQKITRNDGTVRYSAVMKALYLGGEGWSTLQTYDTCKEAEAYIENIWNARIAKTEIITQCEECE